MSKKNIMNDLDSPRNGKLTRITSYAPSIFNNYTERCNYRQQELKGNDDDKLAILVD